MNKKQKWTEKQKSLGNCVRCGQQVSHGKNYCDTCIVKNKEYREKLRKEGYRKKWRESRKLEGLCSDCSKLTKPGCRRCDDCLVRSGEWSKTNRERINQYPSKGMRRQSFKDRDLCWHCGGQTIVGSHYCEPCYLKGTSLGLGITQSGKCSNSRWKELKEIFESQGGICPYTGTHIKLGIDSEIDHIIPRCKNGSNELGNLQWTTREVNRLKGALSEEDFSKLVSAIYNYWVLPNAVAGE